MDTITHTIADYATSLTFDDLPSAVIDWAELCILDSVACAIGGRHCQQAAIGLRLAKDAGSGQNARILGHTLRTTAPMAAFVNTAMIRNLDFNDHYPGGHPSDCLGPLFALAGQIGASGRQLVLSSVVAYETYVRLTVAPNFRDKGWDQGFTVGVATVAGAGNLLGLEHDVIAEAIAITAATGVPLRNTRAGRLSMWKDAATAHAVQNGLFCLELAMNGMTGPDQPFEGRHGLWEQATGPFELPPFSNQGGESLLLEVGLKYWPVEYHIQAGIWAGRELKALIKPEDVESIEVQTYHTAWHESASEPEKWDPRTRQTADHSLPYILARSMIDGTITAASFEADRFLDPALRPLMARMLVSVSEEIEARLPEDQVMKLTATSKSGERHIVEIVNPVGSPKRPLQPSDVREKFHRLVDPEYGAEKASDILGTWANVGSQAGLDRGFDLLEAGGA